MQFEVSGERQNTNQNAHQNVNRENANGDFANQNSLVESPPLLPFEEQSPVVPVIPAAARIDRQPTPPVALETAIQADTESTEVADQAKILLDMLPENFDFDRAWERSTLTSIHRLARASKREGGTHLQELRASEPVSQHLTKAWEHFLQAEKHCSKYWLTPMRLAHLCLLMEHGEDLSLIHI